MGIPWDGTGIKGLWDGTEKYFPWTTLVVSLSLTKKVYILRIAGYNIESGNQ